MPAWVNQHSFFLAAAGVWIAVAVLVVRDGFRPMDGVALAALALASWGAYALLRPAPGSTGEADALRAQIGAGRPVLLEFQSPF